MKVILGKIGSGKTYNILRDCNEKKGILVVPFTKHQISFYERDIKEWGFNEIQKVISFKEYLELSSKEKENNHFCFDNLDLLFKDSDAISITITEPVTLVERVIKEDGGSDFVTSTVC